MASCANHPETVAAAYCRTCGKPLCNACKRDVRGVIYCEECIATRISGEHAAATPGAVPPIPPSPIGASSPNPALAAFLGFIPGVGAMYNGQFVKAFVHIALFAFIIVLTSEASPFFGFFIPAWVLYMVFEAYHTARARQLGTPPPDLLGLNSFFGIRESAISAAPVSPDDTPTDAAVTQSTLPAGAIWLIGLGIFFLLVNVFGFRWNRYLWEFVVIGFGVYLLLGRWTGMRRTRGVYCRCARCRSRYITGPAMMITVGILGFLNDAWILGWGRSWPLFLIVLGAIRMVQMSASTEGHVDYIPVAPGNVPPPGAANTVGNTEVNNG